MVWVSVFKTWRDDQVVLLHCSSYFSWNDLIWQGVRTARIDCFSIYVWLFKSIQSIVLFQGSKGSDIKWGRRGGRRKECTNQQRREGKEWNESRTTRVAFYHSTYEFVFPLYYSQTIVCSDGGSGNSSVSNKSCYPSFIHFKSNDNKTIIIQNNI